MKRIPKELQGVLVSTPDTLGGSIRFQGTRVLVYALLDALTSGRSVEEFLAGYPGVTKDQAIAVIRWEQVLARSAFGDALAG